MCVREQRGHNPKIGLSRLLTTQFYHCFLNHAHSNSTLLSMFQCRLTTSYGIGSITAKVICDIMDQWGSYKHVKIRLPKYTFVFVIILAPFELPVTLESHWSTLEHSLPIRYSQC